MLCYSNGTENKKVSSVFAYLSASLDFCRWGSSSSSSTSGHNSSNSSLYGSMAEWLAHLAFDLGDPGSNRWSRRYSIRQVVYSHCLPSFLGPRNWGTKGSFRRLSGYGD